MRPDIHQFLAKYLTYLGYSILRLSHSLKVIFSYQSGNCSPNLFIWMRNEAVHEPTE